MDIIDLLAGTLLILALFTCFGLSMMLLEKPRTKRGYRRVQRRRY